MDKILFQMPHIKLIETDAGKYCLIVESISLNDYVEDLLWDHFQYESTSITMEDRQSTPVYFNYFDGRVMIDEVMEILKQISPGEAENIFTPA